MVSDEKVSPALRSCLNSLADLSQRRKALLDEIWVLEYDAEVIREKINGML